MKSWDEAAAFALSLPGTILSTSYGMPTVKIAANGRAFLFTSRETDTSFGVAAALDEIEILIETDPDSFWQAPHYVGWPIVLVRFTNTDPGRVRALIERSHIWSAARTPVKPRKR